MPAVLHCIYLMMENMTFLNRGSRFTVRLQRETHYVIEWQGQQEIVHGPADEVSELLERHTTGDNFLYTAGYKDWISPNGYWWNQLDVIAGVADRKGEKQLLYDLAK